MKELNTRAQQLSSEYSSNESVLQLAEQYNTNAAAISDIEARVSDLENMQGE